MYDTALDHYRRASTHMAALAAHGVALQAELMNALLAPMRAPNPRAQPFGVGRVAASPAGQGGALSEPHCHGEPHELAALAVGRAEGAGR